jgi:acetyl-CoA acyltransferase
MSKIQMLKTHGGDRIAIVAGLRTPFAKMAYRQLILPKW